MSNRKFHVTIKDDTDTTTCYVVACVEKRITKFFGFLARFFKFLMPLAITYIIAITSIEALITNPHFYAPTFSYYSRDVFLRLLDSDPDDEIDILHDFNDNLLEVLERADMGQVYVGVITIQLENEITADNVTVYFDKYESPKYRLNQGISTTLYLDLDKDLVEPNIPINLKTFSDHRKVLIPFCITRPIVEEEADQISADYFKNIEMIVISYIPDYFTFQNSRKSNLHWLLSWIYQNDTYRQDC